MSAVGVSSVVEKASASGGDVLWTFDIGRWSGNKENLRGFFDTPSYSGWYSSPTVVDGVVYQGSVDGKVYAMDVSSGNEIWSFEAQDRVFSSPMVRNGNVYFGSVDGGLYALDASEGTEL